MMLAIGTRVYLRVGGHPRPPAFTRGTVVGATADSQVLVRFDPAWCATPRAMSFRAKDRSDGWALPQADLELLMTEE